MEILGFLYRISPLFKFSYDIRETREQEDADSFSVHSSGLKKDPETSWTQDWALLRLRRNRYEKKANVMNLVRYQLCLRFFWRNLVPGSRHMIFTNPLCL